MYKVIAYIYPVEKCVVEGAEPAFCCRWSIVRHDIEQVKPTVSLERYCLRWKYLCLVLLYKCKIVLAL